jgi:preprotein translocase subunit SecA
MKKFIDQIKTESKNLIHLSQDELEKKIENTQKHFQPWANSDKKNSNDLSSAFQNSFLPPSHLIATWFALVQEVSQRTIGLKHFDTQLAAGFSLHEGNIVEMKTGEGKTLASTLPISLNALSKKGVHVVTVNDYLAERDQKWMGKIYKGLGLSVGLVKSNTPTDQKRKSYFSDITYVTNSELVFDYLRDSSAYHVSETVQRPFNYCIIDEIDSVLIDEARTPLILSSFKGDVNGTKLSLAKAIVNKLVKDVHFEVDQKRRDIHLTEEGYQETKYLLAKDSLYEVEDPWILEILNALKAKYIFQLNKDYIVLKNKICIVDEFTGRIMEDRRWSMGIHEAIESKENVEIGGETKTKSSITYQNFFTLYPKLAGMTGTGKTAEKEFQDIYGLDVLVLPTAKPMNRKDLSDFVFQDELSKWKAVLNHSQKCFEKGQPILIGTGTVEKSELVSDLFNAAGIPHQVLNAKPENVFRESEIIAQAGKRSAVTIATNMAGRGTDIILGGNPMFEVKQLLLEIFLEKKNLFLEQNEQFASYDPSLANLIEIVKEDYQDEANLLEKAISDLPYSNEEAKSSFKELYDYLFQLYSKNCQRENKAVKELGGLFVLGTERHETRRIDNQLRGRAGRQGDPGASQFFVSLDDQLIQVFGGDGIRKWVQYLIEDKDIPLESTMLTQSLENAQKKVEMFNYDTRKNVFEYDTILNNQRKEIFTARQELLTQNDYNDLFLCYSESIWNDMQNSFLTSFVSGQSVVTGWEYDLEQQFDSYSYSFLGNKKATNFQKDLKTVIYSEIWISHDLEIASSNCYQNGFLKLCTTKNLLEILDFCWTEHLERMNYIRETINWRSYGQQKPLVEYGKEAYVSYNFMLQEIQMLMLYYFLENTMIQ